jgi:hypothetical protein
VTLLFGVKLWPLAGLAGWAVFVGSAVGNWTRWPTTGVARNPNSARAALRDKLPVFTIFPLL